MASFSCGKSGEDVIDNSFNYRIDTLVVDAKGEILYLEYDLRVADYSEVDGFLYNFNKQAHSIEKIDLDRLEWVETSPLQQEGPDGTGFWISDIQSVGGGSTVFIWRKGGDF